MMKPVYPLQLHYWGYKYGQYGTNSTLNKLFSKTLHVTEGEKNPCSMSK